MPELLEEAPVTTAVAVAPLCWLLGTSVRKIDMVRTIEQACLPKPVRGGYHKQGPFCLYCLATRPFHKGEVQFVLRVCTFIQQRVCCRFHAFRLRTTLGVPAC
jgi:hypothetical protein